MKNNIEAGRGATPAPVSGWTPAVVGAVATTLILWASAFSVIRVGLRGLGPGHLAIGRFGTACVVLWALVLLDGVRSGRWPRVPRRDWPLMLAAGALGTTAYHALLNWGEVSVPAGPASFLIATAPMWGLLLAPLAGEKAPRGVWGGVGLALAGVFLISWGQSAASAEAARAVGKAPPSLLKSLLNPAALLILGAAAAGGSSGVIYKNLLGRGQSTLHLTAISTLIGTLLLAPFAPGLGEKVASAPREALWSAVYLGVFPTAIAYLAWTFAIGRAGLTRVLPVIYFIPVLASILAWVFLREALSPLQLAGGAVVLAGIILAQAGAKKGASKGARR